MVLSCSLARSFFGHPSPILVFPSRVSGPSTSTARTGRVDIWLDTLVWTPPTRWSGLEKVVGLTGFVIIHVFFASFSPAEGERNQMVNAKFTRPVNAMPMSSC